MFTLLYVLARRRRPVRLLKCPDRASLLRPGGLQRVSRQPTAGAGTGFRRLSGRRHITPSGDWASGNPTFALSCGSPGTPSHTPGHVLPVSWHAIFPYCPFGLRSAIRSRDISSHPCPLSGRYNSAPHGAPTTTGTPSPWGSRPVGDPVVRLRCTYRARRRPPTHPLDPPRWRAPRATEVARSHGSCPSMARRRLQASFRRMRIFIVGD
jgi:hypothetical protein